MVKRFLLALVLSATLLVSRRAALAAEAIAVVTVAEDDTYREAALIAIALRRHLVKKGYLVRDPARVLSGSTAPTAPKELLARASGRISAGLKLYDNLDFSRARATFKAAVTLYREAMLLGGSGKGYIRALHYVAASAFFDNDKPGAARAYSEAIAYQPDQRPDKNIFPPDVLQVFDDTKTAASSQRGTLRIASTPSVEVSVDGRVVGATTVEIRDVLPGSHLIRLRRVGYISEARWVIVTPGGSAEVQRTLKGTPRAVEVERLIEAARAEMRQDKPGPATMRLGQQFGATTLLLVSREGSAGVAAWAEKGEWMRRFQGTVPTGEEATFALALMSAGTEFKTISGCQSAADCPGQHRCQDGQCLAVKPRPVYARWWFWTLIGAGVAGGTVGLVLGLRTKNEQWSAQFVPTGLQ